MRKNIWNVGWRRALSMALILTMVLSMVGIVPGTGSAFASESGDVAVPFENAGETTDPPKPAEPPAPPASEPTQPKPPVVDEPPAATPTPVVTAAPEVTNAPESTATPEAAATPEVTDAPDVSESAVPTDPAASPEATESPEPSGTPEPTVVPAPLKVSLSANVRSAFANGNAIGVSLRIAGGAPDYVVTYQVLLNGSVVAKSDSITTDETASSYSYVARAFGVHKFTATVTDAAGQTAVASVAVPVAVHDTSSLGKMRSKAQSVKLTGDWRVDILAVAASQLGYHESKKDFIIRADGTTQGYSVYGGWYGLPYEEWCAMFVAYCTNYAGISASNVPRDAGCQKLMNAMTARGAYFTRTSGYEPEPGDIIFFNWDREPDPDHVGIVEIVTDSEVRTIEGNHGRAVARVNRVRNDGQIMGYASMRTLMIKAGVLEGEAVAEENASPAVEVVLAMIENLPLVKEIAAMGEDMRQAVYEQVQMAYDAFMSLSEEEQAQIVGAQDMFDALFTYLESLEAFTVEEVQALIDVLPSLDEMADMDEEDLAAAREQLRDAYEAYKALSDEQREQLTGAELLQDTYDAEQQIEELPTAEEVQEMVLDGQRSIYDQTQVAYDAYMKLSEEQRALIEDAEEKFEALFAFFNGMIMPIDSDTLNDPDMISSSDENEAPDEAVNNSANQSMLLRWRR